MEEGVERIGRNAFANNDIYSVFLPKSLTEIDLSFFSLNIKKLIVHNGFKFYYWFKYENYNIWHNRHYYITYEVFKIQHLTIIDGDYNCIKQLFYVDLSDFNDVNLKKIMIVNDKLNAIEKIMIKRLCKKADIQVEFTENLDYQELLKSDEVLYSGKNEITEKIKQIQQMIASLDSKNQQLITNRVNNLIKEYQTKLDETVDVIDYPTTNLKLNNNSPLSLKVNFLLELDNIIQTLNSQKGYLTFLKKIEQYQLFLQNNYDESIEEDSVIIKIKKIIEISNKINRPIFKAKLQKLLMDTKENIKENIKENMDNNNNIKLTLVNPNIEDRFNQRLQTIYDETIKLSSELSLFVELLDTLNKRNNQNDIGFIMETIEKKLSKISLSKKDDLYNKYNDIIEKYRKILESYINNFNSNDCSKFKIYEMKIDLCKELQNIANEIEVNLEPNSLLYTQIHNARFENDDDKLNAIYEVVKEIKKLLDSEYITINIRKEFLHKIENIFDKWEKVLNDKKINEIAKKNISSIKFSNDYLNVEMMILSELYGVLFLVNDYINKMKEYHQEKDNLAYAYFSTDSCSTKRITKRKEKIRINYSERMNKCDWFDFQFMDE